MKMNPFKIAEKTGMLKNRTLDLLLNVGIPFNRWLGMHIEELTQEKAVVTSPPRKLRENHVGSTHACMLALMGEYPAGLLIAQKYPIDEYRFIIQSLHMDYFKQGFGTLTSTAEAPEVWPEVPADGEQWLEMKTVIKNEKEDVIATAQTKWQLKPWSAVRKNYL